MQLALSGHPLPDSCPPHCLEALLALAIIVPVEALNDYKSALTWP